MTVISHIVPSCGAIHLSDRLQFKREKERQEHEVKKELPDDGDAERVEVTPDIIKMEFDPFTCSTCHISFTTEKELIMHKRSHSSGAKKFACFACNKFYTSQINLIIHLHSKVHEPKKKYYCGYCQKRFSYKLYLQRHRLRHLQSGSLVKCQDCWKKFSKVSEMLLHQKKHRQRFDCTNCRRSFVSQYLLQYHKCGKLFQCFCKKTFASQISFQRHQEVHLNDKPHKCHICGKTYTICRYLENHLELHARVADAVVCDICFKKFPKMSCLKSHKKTHKQLRCELCQQGFNRKIDLLMHRKIHKKVYPCDTCGRSYRSAYCLKRHQKTHDRPEFIQCLYCDKKFRFQYLLERHLANSHIEKMKFSCEKCSKVFFRQQDLNLHLKVHEDSKHVWDDSPGLLGYLNYTALA